VVPPNQTEVMVEALRRNGNAVGYFRPPDLRDFAMPPIRRLGAVLCQETEFRWR
jgi:hypothetical protein